MLSSFQTGASSLNEPLRDFFLDRETFDKWAVDTRTGCAKRGVETMTAWQRMNRVNPKYVLRNYLAQTAIEKAQQKDFSEIDRLLTLLQNPYRDQPGMDGLRGSASQLGQAFIGQLLVVAPHRIGRGP